MTLVEHLYELRYRLGMALLAGGIGALVCCLWFNFTIWPIPRLSKVVLAPYCSGASHTLTELVGGPDKQCGLLQTKPFEGFSILLQVGITTGVVLSSPFWLHQLWAFITPGLRRKERRFGVAFVCFGSLLFLLGAVVAYLLLPEVLRVVTSIAGSDNLLTAFSAGDYVSFLINLLVVFGISFELPLVVVILNFAGVLRYQKVRQWRRGFFFAIVIFAALVTPGTDAISMVILAGALSLLFELALQVARMHDKRLEARRKAEGWDTDDPDTASELQHAPEPVLAEDSGATLEPGRPGPLAERPSTSPAEPPAGRGWDEDAT